MTTPDDKLEKLAEERKQQNPFEKIDAIEEELNLDDSPETKDDNALDEDPIVTLGVTEQLKDH
ncbi:hypothetical protein IV487_13115 [Enterococcus saccharolyticus]|uniref:hypothetical protein n=1 Tax=Enterococcus saccharolyticus TaxID=41997 RepID=UPI001E4AF974|nr:hypothetical protein [Enterococcus saccharolyticus]MCD5003403.1 hypothetical protein [Enterococcus saccharolyticus]